jgi:hypothetical protein
MVSKRSDTDASNHFFGANTDPDICIGYQGSNEVCTGPTALTVDTWYAVVQFYDDDTDTKTVWVHTNGGTFFDSDTFTPTQSASDDSTNPQVSICGVEVADVVEGDADIITSFWTFMRASELTFAITDADNFATDPINTQNAWLVTYSGAVHLMFNEARVDISGNGETITFTGNAAWGTGNGPNVPAESGGGALLLRRQQDE